MAIPPPFGSPPTLSMVPNADFSSTLSQLGKVKGLANLNVMMIDLTNQPKRSVGRGTTGVYNGAPTRYIASCGKVSAMFAAFRLRKNFREAAAEATARTADELVAEVEAAWRPLMEHTISGLADFPKLKTIFDITGGNRNWEIQFSDRYYKRMEGMIGPSHNDDASYCILNLGYQYIQGALIAEGFYTRGAGGLWLTGDYAKGRDGPAEPSCKSNQAGNVEALAKFMMACSNQVLVKDSASSQMRRMMNNAFQFRILRDLGRPVAPTSFGKLGIGFNGTYYDACHIERTTAKGTPLRYVVVILGSQGAGGLWSCGQFVDDIIAAEHGG